MNSTLLKKPVFWVIVLIASGLCVFTVLRYFGDAFSVLDLDVRMSRDMAIGQARQLVVERKLTTVPLSEAAASFDGDSSAQTFIELEGGGKPALKPLIEGDEFTLYKWRVRLYSPGVEREVQVAFTPDGRPSGFFSKVPEAEPGAALSADDARAIAVAAAAKDWGVVFDRYRPLTASAVTRPGKRVDHEFIYERRLEGAPSIGEGRLRLRMVVSGDRLTQLQRFIFVPEAFARRYSTLRSVNNNIAAFASVTAGLVYGLGGCLVGLIWLMRRHAVRWGPASKWAGVVAILIAAASLASIAGSWFGYDTATSASTHLITRIGAAVVGGVVAWLLLTVIFATAEGLGRLAFGDHPQLWRSWHRPAANSRAIWGRTLAGYAWIGFDLAFIAVFYFLVQRYLGWWSPSDSLIDPNILGAPQPWIAPVANSLQAGLMEESLFRAVPLAGAALLGRYFKRESLFIGVALVVQAIVFGCAHANYPGEPAYARPVELFVPALIWGVVYLRYGLVPGMLFHFGFDLLLMSIPLFVTDAPGIVFDRAMVVAALLVPIAVLVVQRVRAGRLIDLPASERNAAASLEDEASRKTDEAVLDGAASTTPEALPAARGHRLHAVVLVVFAIAGAIGLAVRLAIPDDAPALAVTRAEALEIAERALADRGVVLDAGWHRSLKPVAIADPGATHFVWREGGKELYARLIGGFLPPPHWEVRFARFDGDVARRESWRVVVVDARPAPDGIRVIEHDIPEAQPGKRLAEADARVIAGKAIADWLKLAPSDLRPVSAEAIERPSRVDWVFVHADPAVALPAGAEARIQVEVDGDQVVSVGRILFIPDAWSREERHRNERLIIPRALLALVLAAFGIVLLVSVVRHLVRGQASRRAAWVGAAVTAGVGIAGSVLRLNSTQFNFSIAEPFDGQMLRVWLGWIGVAVGSGLVAALVSAVGVRIEASALRPKGPTRETWLTALAIGLLAAGASGLASLLSAPRSPRVPSVDEAASGWPLVSALLGGFELVGAIASMVVAANLLSSRRRSVEVLIAAGFVAAAAFGAMSTPDGDAARVALGAVAGLFGWWVYRTWIRDRPDVIAPSLLCLSLFALLHPLIRSAIPGGSIDAVSAALGTSIGYAIWRWLVRKDSR